MSEVADNIQGSDLFFDYLNQCKDKVQSSNTEDYYPVNVVADAYKQGYGDGEKSGKRNFVEMLLKNKIKNFTLQSNQIYILSQKIISSLKEKSFSVESLHIRLNQDCSRVVLSIKESLLLDDDFVERAYSKISEVKQIYKKLFDNNLDVSLVSHDTLDVHLLKDDGFGYSEVYSNE